MASETKDCLIELAINQWEELKKLFESDWPRGLTGFYALDTLENWIKQDLSYGFKIFNPFGEARNGIVAVIKDEQDFTEMLIECPQDDTTKLEDALKETKLIIWNKDIVVLFPHSHVVECLKRVAQHINMKVDWIHKVDLYVLDRNSSLYDVSLPDTYTFKHLTEDMIDLVNSTWPHRYPGSTKYFQLLIQSKSGYGLFSNQNLVSFGFVKEMGALGHLYTFEQFRRRGFGEIVTKLICNEVLKEKKDVFSFCVEGNVPSCKMHEKLGFVKVSEAFTVQLSPTKKITTETLQMNE